MHVASIMVFSGEAPRYDEFLRFLQSRLDRVPRYRQRLAFVPLEQGRPVWVDDPHFNVRYHLRHSALPSPGEDAQLAALAGRLFAERLDRDKPLWEMNLVEGLAAGSDGLPRFAVMLVVESMTLANSVVPSSTYEVLSKTPLSVSSKTNAST